MAEARFTRFRRLRRTPRIRDLVREVRLTPDQRRVIVLRFLQGHSTAETARRLGKTEDAVKKLQSRGLQILKKYLSPVRDVLAVA